MPKDGYLYEIQCCSDRWIAIFSNRESVCPVCHSIFSVSEWDNDVHLGACVTVPSSVRIRNSFIRPF